MDLKTKTRMEYEQQYFDVTSELILEAYEGALKDTTTERVEEVKNLIAKKLLSVSESPEQLQEAIETFAASLTSEFERGASYARKAIETKIRDIFNIPDWICCEEDAVALKYVGVNIDALNQKKEDLKQELKNMAYMTAAIKEEIEIADNAINELEKINSYSPDMLPDVLSECIVNLSIDNI